MILMFLKVPSFPSLFNFVSLSSRPSFVIILFCFIFLTCVFISFCFLLVVSFCPAFVTCLYSFFFFYYFHCALPFIIYSDIYCSLCFLWLLYEPWAAKWRGFFKEVCVFTEISRCQLLSVMKRRDNVCILTSILLLFYLCWKPNFYLIGVTGSFVCEK